MRWWKLRTRLGTGNVGLRTRYSVLGTRYSVPGARGALAVAALVLVSSAGCRKDMHDKPKLEPLESSAFFENGAGSRPLVEDTVARGQLRTDAHLVLGRVNNHLVHRFPFPVTRGALD